MSEKIPLIALAGPTASGKTAVSIALAKRIGGEIISADSMQIYKGMDIGTAKPTMEERSDIPHHLIDILEPWEPFSVANYACLAHQAIAETRQRGHMPVLCGGTGLYLDAVLQDIAFQDTPHSASYRQELEDLAQKQGKEAIYALLQQKDKPAADRLHPNDLRRVIRALEVLEVSGKSILEQEALSRRESRYRTAVFCIDWPREQLYHRIEQRVDQMIQEGLLQEVQKVYSTLPNKNVTAMQSLGYKEFIPYLSGESSLESAIEMLKQDTRRYAKRQLTWFRRNKEAIYLPGGTPPEELARQIETVLSEKNFLGG